jgi:hypothetical protein
MAKRANGAPASALDAIENGDDAGNELIDEIQSSPADVAEALEPEPLVLGGVMIEIPTAEIAEGGYLQRHLDVRLTPRQATAAKRIFEALNRTDARLVDGRHIDRLPQAMQWVLDRAADEIGLPA